MNTLSETEKRQIYYEKMLTDAYKLFLQNETNTPSGYSMNKLSNSSVKSCFDKAFEEVVSPKTCTQVLASYKYDEESIFAALPKELIAYIFEINNQVNVPHFDAFHDKLESTGSAPEYLKLIASSKLDAINSKMLVDAHQRALIQYEAAMADPSSEWYKKAKELQDLIDAHVF